MGKAYKVIAIRAAAGGYATVVLENNSVLSSASAVVQTTLLGAFLVGGQVDLETEGMTNFVKRVNAFEAGTGRSSYPSDYRVNRVATQRDGDGVDHFEAFLQKPNDAQDTAYNVYDSLCQQLLMAAFAYRHGPTSDIGLRVTVNNTDIVGVALGMP